MPTLTAKTRKAIYALGVAVAGTALVYGLITAERAAALLGVLYAATNLLALVNVTPDDDPADAEITGGPIPRGGYSEDGI